MTSGTRLRRSAVRAALALGLTLAAATAAAPAASEPQAAAGKLGFQLTLRQSGPLTFPCPGHVPVDAIGCVPFTGTGSVRGLGNVSVTYTGLLGVGPLAACPVDFAKPLPTTGRLSVAGKGQIFLTFAEGARCVANWLSVPQKFTITGGTGPFAGGSGSGRRDPGTLGTETWTGTLAMPGQAPAVQGAADARRPDSVRLFRAWLAAFNSGDRTRYARFLKRNFPSRALLIDRDMRLREFTGAFDLRKLGRVSATRVSGWVEEGDSDQFESFVMWVSAAKRPKILALDLVPIPRPAAIPRLTEGKAIAGVKALLRKEAAADRFSGAALVAKDGEVLFADAYGQADRERGIPNTIETRFRMGSMNKMFTAVATLQLVEAGKLALDDTVGKHLRDYPNGEVASKVTVRHLLTHTGGGTGDIFGPEYDANRLQLREHTDYVKLYGSRPLRFEPGTRFEYSNYGFVLLGAIIEAVSGESYYDYVREQLFGPAGMASTDSLPESVEVPNRSMGYTRPGYGAQSWQPNTDWLPWRGTAAGGGYSTVGDVARFADALTNHKLLSPASTELLVSGKVPISAEVYLRSGLSYAFGFFDSRDEAGNGWVGHGGGAPGMNGDLRIYPKSGYVVVVLANVDPMAATRISDYLDPRLPTSAGS